MASLGAAPAAQAMPAAPSVDEAPRLAVFLTALWNRTIDWWPSAEVITAADGEDPPPEEDDPFDGSGGSDPGSGGGVSDPNGG